MPEDRTSGDTRIDWLTLHRAPGIGPIEARRLLEIFHTPAALLSASPDELRELGLKPQTVACLQQPDRKAINADLDWLERADNHHLLTWQDAGYPALLRQIPDPPPVLFVAGEPGLLQSLQLGIVGSRNPDPAGQQIARCFATELAALGITITSGMALGIDACSHRGALQGNGATVAVLGNGPDVVYPARHGELRREIVSRGALVTEYPPGTRPVAGNFPRRNRIISGLATGVLVVEAASRSGSLITARLAMEQGREVFAIPGSIRNPLARGCHNLIRQGAKLVESVEEIVEDLAPIARAALTLDAAETHCTDTAEAMDDDYRMLLEKLAYDPASIDQLVDMTGLTADIVSSMLLILEVRGIVSLSPGGLYMRTDLR